MGICKPHFQMALIGREGKVVRQFCHFVKGRSDVVNGEEIVPRREVTRGQGEHDVLEALIRKAKASTALRGTTLREWIIEAIQEKLRKAK